MHQTVHFYEQKPQAQNNNPHLDYFYYCSNKNILSL